MDMQALRRFGSRIRLIFALALALTAAPSAVVAQPYPTRAIQIIVPYPPGGTAGLMGHMIAPKLSELLGQGVVIEQRPGAATRLGTAVVAKAAPDGYTLLLVSEAPFTLLPHAGPKLQYDPMKDFAPISMVSRTSPLLVVNKDFPADNLKDFIAVLKKEPGKHLYASSGTGGTNHLAGELFQKMAGVEMTHVPFNGTGAAIPALLGNHVDVMFGFVGSVASLVREGRIKALATGATQRNPAMPDIPTMSEAGVPGYEFSSWFGLWAPAGTPPAVVAKLHDAIVAALKDPAIREKLTSDGSELIGSTPEFLGETMKADYAKNADVAAAAFAEKPAATAPSKQQP